MKAWIQGISRRLIGYEMSLGAIFKTLTAIIVVRTVAEKLLSTGHELLYNPKNHYSCLVGDLHMYFSWVVIFLSMSIPVALFLKVRYRDALKLTLIGFCVTLFVPLIDYLFTWGKGDEIRYFRSFDTFLYNYVNLFNPFAAMKGVTLGVRIEVLLLFGGSFLFSFVGFRRGFVRSLFLAFSLYTIVYFYGYILPLHQVMGIDLAGMGAESTTTIEGAQGLFFAYLTPFFLSLAGVAIIVAGEGKGFGKTIVSLLYPSRLLFYLLLLCFGFLFTAHQAGAYPGIINRPDILKLICAAFSISLLFVYAKLINDINDLAIDRVSNRTRPLVEAVFDVEDARQLSTVLMALSFVLAIVVERDFFYFWAFIWALAYTYSAPPFRLRRFWPVAQFILSLIGVGVFMAGACIAKPNNFYVVLKDKEIMIYILLAFFFLCHMKDLKDVEGDRAGHVCNLFGRISSPRMVGLAFFGGFLLMIFLIAVLLGLPYGPIIAGTIVCAAVAVVLVRRSGELADLDRLLTLSFLFLMYVAGLWLVHL